MKNLKIFITLVAAFVFSVSAHGNIVGTDLQNFNPTSSGLDFVTVHSSDTLEPFVFNVGAFATYATNSLPYFLLSTAQSGQIFLEPNDKVFASDLHLGVGLTEWWDLGVNGAFILNQQIDNSNQLGTFAATGLADFRINTKVRLYKDETFGLALNLSGDFDQVLNNPFVGDNPMPTVNLEGIFDAMLGSSVRWGLNLGFRLRNNGSIIPNTGVTPISHQFTFSTAFGFLLNEQWAGARWRAHKKFDVHLGVGSEIIHGLGVPDILAYGGFNWRIGPAWAKEKDTDGDGMVDSKDRCPNTPKAEIATINEVGCSDSDKDGIYNDIDQCPQTPEGSTVNSVGCVEQVVEVTTPGDADGDGVPDEKDQCPGTPPGTKVNDLGCDVSRVEDITLDNLNFVVNSARLTTSSSAKVEQIVKKLRDNSGSITKVVVEGHTDSTGAAGYNLDLSMKRAQTIADRLETGVPFETSQLKVVGYGEQSPIADNNTSSGRAENRRVELRVIR